MSAACRSWVNYWTQDACAKAFWSQQELPAYRRLLADTVAWLDPRPGECWLDLGCGSGALTRAVWEKSAGQVAEIIGLDCAAINEKAYRHLRATVQPPATAERIRFVMGDFSQGLDQWPDAYFNGVMSGMAIQYAESYAAATARWTTDAYDRLLRDVYRLLRPGGRFVFSVNVPKPAWERLALGLLVGAVTARRPARHLRRGWLMYHYGQWLNREARRGRFHYLPAQQVVHRLTAAGFVDIRRRTSYSGLAYVLRCRK
ncbi:MAG: class I SAM-dependent methyltransferase [Gemmataceae bacterium]